MLAFFFESGLVAVVGLGFLIGEAFWWACQGRIPAVFLLSGGFLMAALGLACRGASWGWIAAALSASLIAHLFDVNARYRGVRRER